MASPKRFVESAEHSVTCPLCFEFFVDPHVPKDLECPHTCCQICLQNVVTLNPSTLITCPMKCEKKTRIPAGGVVMLRTNLHLKNLAEEHPGYAKGAKHGVPKCLKHGEKMHLYCSFCNKLACQNCVIVYHKGSEHVIKDVGDTTEEQKEELETVITETRKEIQSCQKSATELKKLETGILAEMNAEKKEIDKHRDASIEVVKKESENLKREVQRLGDTKLTKIRTEVVRLEKRVKTLQTASDAAIQTGASLNHAYITQHTSLVEKMKKMSVKEKASCINRNQQAARFVKGTDIIKLGSVVKVQELELVQELAGFKWAGHIASSGNGLLAVSDRDGQKLIIYHKQNGRFEMKLSVELNPSYAEGPQGAVFCADGKVWLARWTGIEVYSPTGKYEKTIRTKQEGSPGNDVGVYSLAITKDGSRILAGDIKRCVITVHDPTGSIIRTLKTSIDPRRMTVIKDTHVAISDWMPGKVSVMDMETGQETLSVNIPEVNGICYDEHTDHADYILTSNSTGFYGTGKVEQYCWRTGRLIACVAQGLYHPCGITITLDGMLTVADEKFVKIYKMS